MIKDTFEWDWLSNLFETVLIIRKYVKFPYQLKLSLLTVYNII